MSHENVPELVSWGPYLSLEKQRKFVVACLRSPENVK